MFVDNFVFVSKRLKKKDESPRIERELSDAYIDSISRTPRYGLGRHNTYDDMLESMNPEDPFKGNYEPSGKSPRTKRAAGLKKSSKKENLIDNEDEERSRSKRKSRKKKHKKTESTADSHTNKAFTADSDRESTRSNGTYTLNDSQAKDVRTSITNMAAPVLKKSPTKVKSLTVINVTNKQEEMDNVSFCVEIIA